MSVTPGAFIDIAITAVEGLVAKYSADILAGMAPARDGFAFHGRAFVGQLNASPAYWVGPLRSAFADEGQLTDSGSSVTVTIGVAGGDPEMLQAAALDYVRAVHLAIASARPGDLDYRVRRIFIQEHDYGPLWGKQGGFAAFPQLHLLVDMTEEV